MCFNDKGNIKSWNEKVFTFTSFRLSVLREDCNLGAGFWAVEEPLNHHISYHMALLFSATTSRILPCWQMWARSELCFRKILTEVFPEKSCLPKKQFFGPMNLSACLFVMVATKKEKRKVDIVKILERTASPQGGLSQTPQAWGGL